MGLLDGKVSVVTGAAQGIGLAIVRELLAHGSSVVMCDIQADELARAAAGLDPRGDSVLTVAGDVTSAESVDNMLARCIERFGVLDVMVNNAGINRDASMRRMTLEQFRAVVEVGLIGTWLCTRAASQIMTPERGGSIINMSSIAGKIGNAGQTNYSATKSGIVGLTKAAAKECASRGIRVNAVMPGLIRTAMTEAMPPDVWDAKLAEVPMRRAGEPSEVGSAVVFLASDLASYVTGVTLEVAGGRHV